MRRKLRKLLFKSAPALFLFGLLFIMGCSHKSSNHESSDYDSTTPYTAAYQIGLPSQKVSNVKIDLSQHNSDHHSDTVLISAKDDAGIKNTGTKPLQLKITTSGFPEEVKIKTSDDNFDPKSGLTIKPLKPGETIKLNFETTVSEKPTDSAQICSGYVHFINKKTGKELGALNVVIMDSKINNGQIKEEEDCCAIE